MKLSRTLPLTGFLALAACGGGASAVFPVDNPSGSVLSFSETTVSIVNQNIDVALPRNTAFDSGPFLGGSKSTVEGEQILVSSATDATYAAMLISPDDAFAVDLFAGRLAPTQDLPAGAASMTGTYVGSILFAGNDTPGSPIAGTVALDVDFDDMLISGTISERGVQLFDDAVELSLRDITLAETSIETDGVFRGASAHAGYEVSNGNYAGAIGGDAGDEVVGQVVLYDRDADGTIISGEAGIFAIGH